MALNTAQRAVIAERRQTVARLRLRGLTQRDIMEALNTENRRQRKEEQWSLGTINSDIKAIEKEWKAQAVRATDEHKARVLAELDEVLREAWLAKDIKHVLAVLAQMRALLGLDAPARTDVKSLNIDLAGLSNEQLERIAAGEDPVYVLATSGQGGAGTPEATT